MILETFVGPWQLFRFLHPIRSRQDSSDGGSARRKVATYTGQQTWMPPVGFVSTISVFERAKTAHALDRAATVIGIKRISDREKAFSL
jgi:hypothetical protein